MILPGAALAGGFGQGIVEAVGIRIWIVGLEAGIVPVCVEGRPELFEQRWCCNSREPDVPFEAVKERRIPRGSTIQRRRCRIECYAETSTL